MTNTTAQLENDRQKNTQLNQRNEAIDRTRAFVNLLADGSKDQIETVLKFTKDQKDNFAMSAMLRGEYKVVYMLLKKHLKKF